jgi:hypothetical protein
MTSTTATYSLSAKIAASPMILAQNVPINEIPSLGYKIMSNGCHSPELWPTVKSIYTVHACGQAL